MEQPNVPKGLEVAMARGQIAKCDLSRVICFTGHETIISIRVELVKPDPKSKMFEDDEPVRQIEQGPVRYDPAPARPEASAGADGATDAGSVRVAGWTDGFAKLNWAWANGIKGLGFAEL